MDKYLSNEFRNLQTFVCVCSFHISTSVQLICFKVTGCVGGDPRKCIVKFDADWMNRDCFYGLSVVMLDVLNLAFGCLWAEPLLLGNAIKGKCTTSHDDATF